MVEREQEQVDDNEEEGTSKSARKREAQRLQELGQKLSDLKPAQLDDMNLPEPLRKAIDDHQRFPSHEAKRRQLQFIGKLMRSVDDAEIETKLQTFEGHSSTAQYVHAQCETWRERLLSENSALAEYIDTHPDVDRQQLRQLIKRTQGAQEKNQRKIAARALFRYLHEQEARL